MVRHQIEDDLETVFIRGAHQRVEIVHGAKQRIDAGIVGNVVTEIGHRRGKIGDSQTASMPSDFK